MGKLHVGKAGGRRTRQSRGPGRDWWVSVIVGLASCACQDSADVVSGGSAFGASGFGGAAPCSTENSDADGDGISDLAEGLVDTDGDTVPDYRDEDSDNDGLGDRVEVGDPCRPAQCGSTIHHLSADSDGDGILDGDESNACSPAIATSTSTSTGMSQTSTSTTGNDSMGTTGTNGEGGANPGAGGANPSEGGAAGAAGENGAGGAAGAASD